ncbi:MAG TPA: FHA domain-containing protein [Ktedonobacteraceae bacterium]|nr:FHA domain-containing protein [Ktedonobacteraceae bacterium]
MDKCPYCNAETRPGDNFCLNCGNRLPMPGSGPQQASGGAGDATLAADENWVPPTVPAEANGHDLTVGATIAADSPVAVATIENPAHLTLRTDSGETLQEFVLEKAEFAIGRAPSSDILLSKDKLTSRRHATIHYDHGTYFLTDERSANGTFVNGQQLEEKAPYKLQNGDRVAIGEYEMIFHSSAANQIDIESLPTMVVNLGGETYATHEDPQNTAATSDEFGTRPWNPNEASKAEKAAVSAAPVAEVEPAQPVAPVPAVAPIAETPLPAVGSASAAPTPSAPLENSGVTFSRLTNLPQPQLPDVAPLMAALATLDGQVSSLQEQLNSTQEAMRNHESDIAQTTSQLRSGVRRVSERMDTTIADVARSREQLAWAELLQLMEDVMNNPRDIEYVTKLARKARELNKVFQIHQNVLNTLAECTSLLRSLIGEDHS